MASRGCSTPTLAIQRYPALPLPESGEATLGFIVIVTDVGATVADALAAGGSAHHPASAQPQHGGKVAFVKNGDGHRIERVEMP